MYAFFHAFLDLLVLVEDAAKPGGPGLRTTGTFVGYPAPALVPLNYFKT